MGQPSSSPTRPVALPTGGAPPWSTRARGHTRLVIEMPARSRWKLVPVLVVCGLGYVASLALVRLMGSLDSRASLFMTVAYGVVLVVAIVGDGVLSPRETLEIDSRYVTITRGDQLVYWCPRSRCREIDVWTPPPGGAFVRASRRLAGVSTFAWGDGSQSYGSAGEGISRRAASRLVPIIAEFLADNPPESDAGDVAAGTDAAAPT